MKFGLDKKDKEVVFYLLGGLFILLPTTTTGC